MARGATSEQPAGTAYEMLPPAPGTARRRWPLAARPWTVLFALLACSPEARRVRDGGPGADPNNKNLVASRPVNPTAADTTLWPEKAEAPVDRLADGRMAPPVAITTAVAPAPGPEKPITSRTPATTGDRRSFDKGTAADPRRPSGGDSARPRSPRE
jgi:hypothetical protein